MAKGDAADITARITTALPPWFGDSNPVLAALIAAFASAWSFIYSLYAYARLQTRITTATDGWLDLIAQDFFGAAVRRGPGQSDASMRARILANMFRERGTRAGMISVLTQLTGTAPSIFEPLRPADTGVYGGPLLGYSVAGGYGSTNLPFQAFITVNFLPGIGIPQVAGYRIQTGGYSTPSRLEYASLSSLSERAAIADIYAAIDAVKPAGTIMWTAIGPTVSRLPTVLGLNFVLGNSSLGS
ncbi:hypothetical protein [Sphingomonas sp. 10B4]|uniref:hypothetical protein n=1 Tax=Sphingomonas sp. 10B4 TaxID=3048575 RepID=UPI002AB4CC3A|nr:hypothetical protein [Sphingomonas sp. 10B4]MDY7525477.1 hypothetical protein [Sphingomonas sp. 10B4]MEB0281421.1 hypothetical protein [Sphingomonas sp. 10B4]